MLLTLIGAFLASFGSIYYIIKKKPEVIPSPMKIEDVKEPKKRDKEGS